MTKFDYFWTKAMQQARRAQPRKTMRVAYAGRPMIKINSEGATNDRQVERGSRVPG